MKLLNAVTRQIEEFLDHRNAPPYAILSHRWESGEVSYDDIRTNPDVESKAGYRKIRFCCRQALASGLSHAWVDTCCIDKSSSAELSEAINSIFAWYRDSAVCYVYLSDVEYSDANKVSTLTVEIMQSFRKSQWFTRDKYPKSVR